MGFKTHFSGLNLDSTLHMFLFKDAYLGLAPVENGRANLACLVKIEKVQRAASPQQIMTNLLESNSLLSGLLASGHNLFDHWMEAYVPEFGFKPTPPWPQTYWIGDASSTIPPACGNGLSLAIASGYLAAEFALKDEALAFKHVWKKRCMQQMLFGKGLHYLFLHPSLSSAAIRFTQGFPFFAQQIFNLTRDRGF